MVIENVQLQIKPGQEATFEQAIATCRGLFLAAEGCRGLVLARGVEQPSHYLLQIEWDSVDAHVAFTKTEGIVTFRNLAGPCFSDKPVMAHFTPVG